MVTTVSYVHQMYDMNYSQSRAAAAAAGTREAAHGYQVLAQPEALHVLVVAAAAGAEAVGRRAANMS
jgi:hypothetical protein